MTTADPAGSDRPCLAGKVVVVTGGTRGIGFATAECLASAGATVVLTGRDRSAVEERSGELSARYGVAVRGLTLDLRDTTEIGPTFKAIVGEHQRIDGFVANAGVLESSLIGMISDQQLETLLSVNFAGTILTTQAAARAMMRKKTGSIVLVGSIVARHGVPGQAVYAATKAAVATFASSAARELGRYGIRVNAVAPGVIQTNLIADQDPAVLERVREETPLGRLGEASEVARVIRFLLSEEASFITGQVLGVDGGLVL